MRENDEHRLGDFFRMMGVGGVPQRDGMDKVNIAAHQRGECVLGFALGKSGQ